MVLLTAKEKVAKARAGLILDMPFFGNLAMKLRIDQDPTCKTAWTDGTNLKYNPSYVDSLDINQVKGILAHEVMHCACSHHARRQGRNAKRWNIAADLAVNPILEESGITLPQGALSDPFFKDMSADEIYGKLPDQQDQDKDQDQESDGEGDDQGNDPGGCGEVRDAQGKDGDKPSQADLNQAEQDWKVATAQAAQQARAMAGKLPAGLERLVGELVNPRIPWKEVLRRFVDQAAKNDYQWFPPNRRYIHQGMYLPSLKAENLPPIVIAVDTSASIDNEVLNQFAAEMTAILEDFNTSCTVIYCDAHVANVQEFSSDDLPLKLDPKGGGGTDFRPPFKHVEDQSIDPACFVYLTDMECRAFPEYEPPYPVLWVQYGRSEYASKAPWGETLEID